MNIKRLFFSIQILFVALICLFVASRPVLADPSKNIRPMDVSRPIWKDLASGSLNMNLLPLAAVSLILGVACDPPKTGCGNECVRFLNECDENCYETYPNDRSKYQSCSRSCTAPYNQCCNNYQNSVGPEVNDRPGIIKNTSVATDQVQPTQVLAKEK